KLESLADIAEASLQARLGETGKTLPLYQQALQLDAGLNDHPNEAVDWYMYAMFLRDKGFPARFVYASLLKSRSLLPSDDDANSKKKPASSHSRQGPQRIGAATRSRGVRRQPQS